MNLNRQLSMLYSAEQVQTVFNGIVPTGKLAITSSGLVYLAVDDEFIYRGFNLLADENATLPDYFSPYLGAHISLIYPEELKLSHLEQLGNCYSFSLLGLASMEIGVKKYYFLPIQADKMLNLRRAYGLADKLLFKNHWIDLHITVGCTLLPADLLTP